MVSIVLNLLGSETKKVQVNTDHIIYSFPNEDRDSPGTRIYMRDKGLVLNVTETPEQINVLVNEAFKNVHMQSLTFWETPDPEKEKARAKLREYLKRDHPSPHP